MDFSSYKNFRELLDKDYGVYYERYPNAFLILDFIAQMRTYESLFPGSKYKDNDLYFSMYIDSLIDSKFGISSTSEIKIKSSSLALFSPLDI